MFGLFGLVNAAEPDPKVMKVTLPENLKWTTSASGNSTAVLYGDPSKPGLYIVLTKWSPGHMSRPHMHPNDRFITVISGTWWVGWGPEVRSGQHQAHSSGQLRHALRQADPLRRRQGRRMRVADRGDGTGRIDLSRTEVGSGQAF